MSHTKQGNIKELDLIISNYITNKFISNSLNVTILISFQIRNIFQ